MNNFVDFVCIICRKYSIMEHITIYKIYLEVNMAKLLKRILLATCILCLSLGIVTVAAACNQTEKEPELIEYKVTVTCSDLSASELDTVTVRLNKADGTAAANAKQLSGGSATFELAPATYTVVLSGDILADYTYPATTVSETSPSATVALTAKSVQPQTVPYTVQVTGASELSGISVKLLKEDGTDATEAKTLTNGAATFDLAPATYKVKLLGDVLENYTYTEPTLTATQTSATVTLTAKVPEPPEGKLFYTVTVTCEATPSILTVISVELHTEDGPLAADAQLLVNGVATFTLDPGTYTVVLADADDMLKNYEYEKDITLTADNPSVTIVLTPKDNEPDGSEDYPYVIEGTLAGDYEFTPVKIEVEIGWDTYTTYSNVFYTYTPAADETYTFTTTVNYLGITITDENGATVFNNISGSNRFYKVFSLNAGTVYTMEAWPDVENAPYKEGDKLTWKIQSGEQVAPDVTYTVNVTCDDAQVTAGLSAQLFKADGTPAADAKTLVSGSVTFTLPAGTYTVKLSGEGLAGYSYNEATVSQGYPVANIKLVKASQKKSFLSGNGSANSPYIVDPLTGVYSVPTSGFDSVYIEFTATAEGDYILTTEDDSLYLMIVQNGTSLVSFYYGGSESAHPFHVAAGLVSIEVKNFDETNAPVSFTITRSDGSFDPEKAPVKPDLTPFVGTWTDSGHKVVITEDSLSYSENDDSFETTIDGIEDGILKFTYTEVLLGQETDYHYGLVFNGNALVLVNLESRGTGKDYFNGYYVVSTLTKQGSAPSVTLPAELTGIWSGYSEDYEATCTLTFDGLNVTYAIEGMMTLPGTVASYDEATHTLTLQLASGIGGDMPLPLEYDPAAHTLTDEMFGVVLSKKGEVTPVELPEELTGVWTGTDEYDMAYELTFDGLNVTFIADKGGMSEMTFSGKVTAYDNTSKQLTITLTEMGTVSFVFDPAAMTLTGSGMFPVTLTKQGFEPKPEQDGSAAHPFIWDTFGGTLEVNLPAGSDQGVPSVYYSYTAKKNGIYSLSYTLNGGSYTDLNLMIYPAGDILHPVAAWNTFDQSYEFPLTANTTYIFRLTDNSEKATGGKLLLTVTEQELTIVSAYNGKWVDAKENPKYTLEINGTTITVNGKTASSVTLVPFNGGYNFIWEGKDCNISIGKTQTGDYESAMLFRFGDGEDDYVALYHPGEVPETVYGTEQNPMAMQQSDLAKSWSDSLSAGEYYWTFTATETKVYTLTTTIDYLNITITDSTAGKDIVNWSTSANLKEMAFEITAGHTYVIFYTDSDNDGTHFKTVTFKIEEGGTIEKATIPQEILDVEWVDETNAKNTISLTAEEVKIHVDIEGITSVNYNGSVTKAEKTGSGYTITFMTSSANLSFVYNSTEKTLTFTAPNSKVYIFTAKQGGGSETWTGTLPDKWSGTWQIKDFGATAPSQSITISGKTITWTTGAGAGKTFTITGYDETNMIISFKTDDGLTGTIERQFTWDTDEITAIKVTLGGTTYQNLRHPS